MLRYDFLILSLLFLFPGVIVFIMRADLRWLIGAMSLAAIPFAFSEFLFYPEYWEPTFLFNLADTIGFGVEDFIFVIALASFTTTGYAFVFKKSLRIIETLSRTRIVIRIAIVFGTTFALVALVYVLSIPMIFGACAAMIIVAGLMCVSRKDLILPAFFGGVIAALVYFILCVIYALIYPGVFKTIWNTQVLTNIFIAGVPIEELLYGFTSGAAAVILIPFVRGMRYVDSEEILKERA